MCRQMISDRRSRQLTVIASSVVDGGGLSGRRGEYAHACAQWCRCTSLVLYKHAQLGEEYYA